MERSYEERLEARVYQLERNLLAMTHHINTLKLELKVFDELHLPKIHGYLDIYQDKLEVITNVVNRLLEAEESQTPRRRVKIVRREKRNINKETVEISTDLTGSHEDSPQVIEETHRIIDYC